MKYRILINIHYLELGGAEAALIGLLHSLDPKLIQVDLLLNQKQGELLKFVPDWVDIVEVPKAYSHIETPIKETIKKGFWGIALARLWAKYKFYRYKKKVRPKDDNAIFGYVGKYVTPLLPSLKNKGTYDLAISWLAPHNIVLEKVNAKKKVCWIHTDYSNIDVDRNIELPVWNGYDHIISISDKVTATFSGVFPELKDKIIEIENILPVDIIRRRADEFIPHEISKSDDTINILTIGRFSYAKNLEAIPLICKLIRERGFNIKWHIIGYGISDRYIREAIAEHNMEEHVKILGRKENPYPYIKACDWYIQPSRYEGKSITVQEAQILGKLVAITNYPTAASQIKDRHDGFIGPYEPKDFASYLISLISDLPSLEKVRNNLKLTDFYQQQTDAKLLSIIS